MLRFKNIPDKDKKTFSLDGLENSEKETVVAEYDENTDEVVQANLIVSKGMEDRLNNALETNDGILIIQ